MFSEEEKQTQCEKGKQIVPWVRKAFDAGEESVTIPLGDYRFGRESFSSPRGSSRMAQRCA